MKRPIRHFLLGLGIGAGSFCFAETLSRALISLRIARPEGFEGRSVQLYRWDGNLGWRNRPHFRKTFDWGYRKTREHINEAGWRDFPYPTAKPKGVFRIAAIGCSETYGFGVDMEETYPKVLERELRERYGPAVEVLNFGVNGYGLSQFLINYERHVAPYEPDLVLVQFYRPSLHRELYTEMWRTQKPAFRLENGALRLVNHPVPPRLLGPLETWLTDHSAFFRLGKDALLKLSFHHKEIRKRFIHRDTALNELGSRIFRRFRQRVEANGSRLLVFSWYGDFPWLASLVRKAGVRIFRVERFAEKAFWEKQGPLHNPPPVVHWSPVGHRFVAAAIGNYLERHDVIGKGVRERSRRVSEGRKSGPVYAAGRRKR